jgi:Ni/Co efflux regulator RcnB
MKRIIITTAAMSMFIATQAQSQDSTDCQKIQAKINQIEKVYRDSFEVAKNKRTTEYRIARKNFVKDSIGGAVAKDAKSPTLLSDAVRAELAGINKRQFLALSPLRKELKSKNCK